MILPTIIIFFVAIFIIIIWKYRNTLYAQILSKKPGEISESQDITELPMATSLISSLSSLLIPVSSPGEVTNLTFDLDALIRKWVLVRGNLTFAEIKAIVMVESSGKPNSQNPSDPSWGLMGIMPLIGKTYGNITDNQQLFDPDVNLKAGTGFLSHLKARYHKQYPDYQWVQAYNIGETKFDKGTRNPQYYQRFLHFFNQYNK